MIVILTRQTVPAQIHQRFVIKRVGTIDLVTAGIAFCRPGRNLIRQGCIAAFFKRTEYAHASPQLNASAI
jgi:hypothetical protein